MALITGAARRVGRAIALRLAAAGFDIAFTYHASKVEAEELVGVLQKMGRRSLAIRTDLTQSQRAATEIGELFNLAFTRLDVLVNNASLYEPSSLQAVHAAQMRRLWAIHVESPLLLCQKFEKSLRQANGHIINMVDLLAETPWPAYLAYCTSKAGLSNLTLGLAKAMAPQVTVNGIAPGVVSWPDNMPEADRARYLQRVPLGRAGTPEDVAELVYFLCTGGRYITGQILHLDGGRSVT